MKVTGVRTKLYEFDLDRPLGDANDPTGRNRIGQLVVQVDTDEGLTGISLGNPGAQEAVHWLSGLIEGENPAGVKGLWQRMVSKNFKRGNEGPAKEAMCHLDMALWDLKAKANGEPLWRTLGAVTPRVRAYASGIDLPLSDDELRAYYERMAAQGITIGKLKVGIDPEADLRRLEIMRDALSSAGGRAEVAIDSNEYWAPKQAIRRIREIERHFDLLWCEEPARRWDYRGLRKVSESVTAAVATGENLNDVREFMPLVANEAVDIVQVGIYTSGITGALQVAELANAFELPVAMMNSAADFMVHLAAALPNHLAQEIVAAGTDRLVTKDQRIEDGWIILGDQPGLGVTFDEAAVEHLAVDRVSGKASRFPWGRRPGAGLYEVPFTEEERQGRKLPVG
ncbi:mandelate racemase/muconate lactonizing enzyme family protein [Actinopolymorpha alba]|uniref:mandelate racemase/muconate lactonizing enzyme family protein n=1 Tax=Actinopolymorpha alba TaxID=533267 RepID=UPI000365F948|nr:mandelate racemase/muconate lactonizing enzyme family protein [Actinopolymorpha alba]